MTTDRKLLVFAALSGAMAVAVGAFGAHGVGPREADWLRTAGEYQLVHAVLGAAIAFWAGAGRSGRVAGWLVLTGGLIFCLSLCLLALADMRFMGAIVPVGGTLMIIGWLTLVYRAFRRPVSNPEIQKVA